MSPYGTQPAQFLYNGDGTLKSMPGTIFDDNCLYVDSNTQYVVYAEATTNYTAAVYTFKTSSVEPY